MTTKCEVCEEQTETLLRAEDGTELCEICFEQDLTEPEATITTSDHPHGLRIGKHRNMTRAELGENHFETEWHSTDAWRGYVKIKAKGDWQQVDADQILTAWNDKELKGRYDKLKEKAEAAGLEWALASGRTSNVFSNSAEFYILGDPEQLEEVEE